MKKRVLALTLVFAMLFGSLSPVDARADADYSMDELSSEENIDYDDYENVDYDDYVIEEDEEEVVEEDTTAYSYSGKPIIFIPGIFGSELFRLDDGVVLSDYEESIGSISSENINNATRVYVPVALNRDYINESINKNNELYALQQGNLQDVKLVNLHSGPAGIYYPLLNKLMCNFPDRPVYLFSYDWRDSNVETRDKLYNFINEITDNHKTKVDIIAHSMGGLVTSHYAAQYDDTVDKIITIGTPYEGASTVYNSLELNRVIGNLEDSLATAFIGVDTSLLLDTPGLSELLPSARFYNKYPIQVIENNDVYKHLKENRRYYISNLKTKHLDYGKFIPITKQLKVTSDLEQDKVDQFMINRIGLDRHTEFINNSSMYRENGQRDGNINLLNRANTTFLVSRGYETDVSTVLSKDGEGYKLVDTISSLEGDTLVPLYSATMGIEVDDMPQDLRDKFIFVNGNHVTMLSRPKNLNKIIQILSE